MNGVCRSPTGPRSQIAFVTLGEVTNVARIATVIQFGLMHQIISLCPLYSPSPRDPHPHPHPPGDPAN